MSRPATALPRYPGEPLDRFRQVLARFPTDGQATQGVRHPRSSAHNGQGGSMVRRHLDSRDFAAYSRLFAKDGEWTGGLGSVSGPASIQAFMEKSIGTGPNRSRNYHLLSNFVITVTGDTATAWSRWAFVVPGERGAVISQAGRCDDTLVREDGRWKFTRRVASNDTSAPAPAPSRGDQP